MAAQAQQVIGVLLCCFGFLGLRRYLWRMFEVGSGWRLVVASTLTGLAVCLIAVGIVLMFAPDGWRYSY
jgi:hypothetical protein